MQTVDFIIEPEIAPARSLATDRHFMHAVQRASRTRPAVLRVYSFAGDLLSLGRYHLAPEPRSESPVGLMRRLTGGRAVPTGAGFVGLSLILPHRSALLSAEPFALAPYQVMNRYVRGILEGCKLVNIAAFYPGRDFVTVDGRIIGMVSFETDEHGALLFEAVLANTHDFSLLPRHLEATDSAGVVKAEMLTPDSTTCLARELGTELRLDEVADMLQRGYAKQFGLMMEPHTLSPLEVQAIDVVVAREFPGHTWVSQRRRRADLDHVASVWVQLGVFEAHFALEQDRFIKEIQFCGDFIANSPSIAQLERELRLCPAEWRAIDAIASEIFSQPDHFILGIGKARAIADTIMKGFSP